MFLLILESIGTAELLLIGLVALIFFGPRKLPEFARTLGKWRNEFRKTTDEFKNTWQKEVETEINQFKTDVEKIGKDVDVKNMFDDTPDKSISSSVNIESKAFTPEIREVSQEDFQEFISAKTIKTETVESAAEDKRNWL